MPHAATEKSSKKRKLASENPSVSPEKKSKTIKPDKGKGKEKQQDGDFQEIQASLVLSIPPIFANDLRAGAEEMLDSMIMRYIPAFRGVVLSHSNLRFLSKNAKIIADCPYSVCQVGFDVTVWCPRVGMKLIGKVNLFSPDHVSLLVHRTFNVSIPRHHIPSDEWEFAYGPAENDPEFGPNASLEDGDVDMESDAVDKVAESRTDNDNEGPDSIGRWIHHSTLETMGGRDGFVEFTVVGLTVANEMLSLIGSIQSDPLSPTHVQQYAAPQVASRKTHSKPAAQTSSMEELDEEIFNEKDEEEEEDTFAQLTKEKKEKVAKSVEKPRKRESKKRSEEGRKGDGGTNTADL